MYQSGKLFLVFRQDKDKNVRFRHNRLTFFIAKKLKKEFKIVDTSRVFWWVLNLAVGQNGIFGI